MHRRGFLLGCTALGACDSVALARSIEASADRRSGGRSEDVPRAWTRSLLVDPHGQPLKAGEIPERRTLLFHYPFVGTPAFLLNLGRPTRRAVELQTEDRDRYTWAGGVGARRSVVAFSAICAHKLAYPTREISFIDFRADASPASRRRDVIHCCAEHSQYDPADGARVLSRPAQQPLAAIVLEHEPATDRLYATATQGGELFERFFASFEMKLSLEHGDRAMQPSADVCVVQPIEAYCRQLMRCA